MSIKRYYGKYRGVVMNNLDLMKRGRIQAQVPGVAGFLPSTWCEPCLPFAGIQSGACFLPALRAGVWIEFERGDPAHPIWTGCFWPNAAEMPLLASAGTPASPNIVMQTTGQSGLLISDTPPSVTLKAGVGLISITPAGIVLQNGSATIAVTAGVITISNGSSAIITMGPGPAVAINGAALVVT